ncbi:hypothetical protein [Streptomyces sp. MN6]
MFIVPGGSVHAADPSERTSEYLRFTQATGIRLDRRWGDVGEWIDEWGSVRPQV